MTARSRSKSRLTLFRERLGYHRTFPEQTAIATVFTDMDTEITALTHHDKTRALKQAMDLLTGRIRLGVNEVAAHD